jgi:endonuclease YncB( thermonuclease family)
VGILVAFALVLATAAPALAQSGLAYVTRVVEGDLIYAEMGGRIEAVRYLGVNALAVDHPSRGREPYAAVARERNRELLEGRWVRLRFEGQPRDQYGRLLAYVWVGKTFVNAALLHWGYAEAAPAPGLRYSDYFKQLEAGARQDGRGLWRYGEVRAYYRPGGLEVVSRTGADQERAATAVGGRVYSAPAPFTPPSPGTASNPYTPAVGPSVAPSAPTSTRNAPSVPRGTMGTRY